MNTKENSSGRAAASHRAGRYVSQSTGYRAFIPEPLPPRDLNLDRVLMGLLSRADLALGRLDGAVETLPHPDLFTAMYVRREAVLSSQIEGTQASLDDLVEAEARLGAGGVFGEVLEVFNYVAALKAGIDRLESLPVSARLLREIHGRLMTGVRGGQAMPGEFRTTQNWIGGGGATLATAAFVPPPPAEVAEHISRLERFLHDTYDIPALVKIGLAHAQFETIHPFVDGNGRLGRLLITFLLIEQRVLSKPILYVSLALKRRRQEYYERLQAVRDEGAWEAWLAFFLECVEQAAQDASRTARSILALREDHRARLVGLLGARAGKGLTLHERLFQYPYIDVNEAARLLDVSYPNANTLIAEMVKAGVLVEETGQRRHRIFVYRPYLALFSDI